MDSLEEFLVLVPLSSPAARVLRRTGGRAALEAAQALREHYRSKLVREESLSIWPREESEDALVFQARVPRAILSASGGEKTLADQVLGMLEEAAKRLGKEPV